MKMKIIMSLLALIIIWGIYILVTQSATPIISTELAIANVNGGNYEWTQMNLMSQSRHIFESIFVPLFLSFLILIGLWGKNIKNVIVGK